MWLRGARRRMICMVVSCGCFVGGSVWDLSASMFSECCISHMTLRRLLCFLRYDLVLLSCYKICLLIRLARSPYPAPHLRHSYNLPPPIQQPRHYGTLVYNNDTCCPLCGLG